MGPGESYMGLSLGIHTAGRLVVKDLEYGPGRVFKEGRQVTSHYIITEYATPAGCSVTWFTSRPQ